MAKAADRYLEVDPWILLERGFHPEHGMVSESLFALGNEYMGVRAYFEEGYSGERLVGSYFNGVYEAVPNCHPAYFKSLSTRMCFMVNAVDWLYTRLRLDGEALDLATSRISDFERRLDLRTGLLTRSFVWHTAGGKSLRVTFERFLSMTTACLGGQRLTLESLNFSGPVEVLAALDFSPLHMDQKRNFWNCTRQGEEDGVCALLGETLTTGQRALATFQLQSSQPLRTAPVEGEKLAGVRFTLDLAEGQPAWVEKMVVNHVVKDTEVSDEAVWADGLALAREHGHVSFDAGLAASQTYWDAVWRDFDLTIEGDPENQQGARYCVFQMHQTYHGEDPSLNIGAKGLTGEAYLGATFWDTETYCLPFYLFNNPRAAKNLLLYRYQTLPGALQRAAEQDCRGARYPFITIDGTESCGVWQHGDLEVHVSGAVGYAIWHYARICDDREFLYGPGMEMLLQISRYYASRGQWHARTGEFGMWGVMGADEFHMMVHNNCYTNLMAKKCFEWTLEFMAEMAEKAPEQLAAVSAKVELQPGEPEDWRRMADKMRLPQEATTGLYEQHDGYFDLPQLDLNTLHEFPIYKFWSYDRIFRYDMIKQPDVLLMLFFFSQEYPLEQKRVNYEYYEPRCIHESSLSPGVHAILAAELGKHADADKYSHYATRLDLDNYNRNTDEGIHTTSTAAAWMNVVYGFGGLRSDGKTLIFNPSLPHHWQAFSFRVLYRGSRLEMRVDGNEVALRVASGDPVRVKLYGEELEIGAAGVRVPLPEERKGKAQ
jgi:maltose phosphorylase